MPTTAQKRTPRDTVINLRMPAETRDLLDAAAAALGKTRTQFVVESASQHAFDVLLNNRIFRLDEDAFESFYAVLENPPAANQKLKELFAAKAPWEP